MKPVGVKVNTYIDDSTESHNKDPKFKVLIMLEYKNIFAKEYVPNWSEEIFLIKKVKDTVPWTYVVKGLNGEGIMGTSYEKELQKADQAEFRTVKIIKRKGDKLYVKLKGYDNSFKS